MANIHTLESDTLNANSVKDIVLQKLITEKLLTEEQAEDFAYKFQVILVPPNWYQRWKTKLGITDNENRFKMVKFEE